MKVLALSLSLRQGSFNKKLIKLVESMAKSGNLDNTKKDLELEVLDLLNYDMPNYNEDLENKGFPESVVRFKAKLETAAGIIIATPEYNYSYPGHFKNLFDWVSRFHPMPWQQKAVLFLSASPALAGGERAIWPLRVPFEGCGAFVYPAMLAVPTVHKVFNEQGECIDQHLKEKLQNLLTGFVKFMIGLNNSHNL